MWATLEGGRCFPNQRSLTNCFKHARPMHDENARLVAENTDLKLQLKTAQRALARHHEAQRQTLDPFPNNARIE